MVYKVIGLMSGSSLDGLDLAYVHLQEKAATGKGPKSWEYTLVHTACYPYSESWRQRLAGAPDLSALEYQLLHAEYGHYLGEQVLRFIEEWGLHFQVQLIASHGHTAFHLPARKMTAQLGDGAALAAVTRINVVSDLRSMDVALGGQGAPIVPVGERWLLPGYAFFLNLGGIANVSRHGDGVGSGVVAGGGAGADGGAAAGGGVGAGAAAGGERDADGGRGSGAGGFVAFDVCPANRVLNALAAVEGLAFDEDGMLAGSGRVDSGLLEQLNALPYYNRAWPKSLANEFGTETVLPLVRAAGLSTADALRTYVEHIAVQVRRAVEGLVPGAGAGIDALGGPVTGARLLATGGGAHNSFLISRLREELSAVGVEIVVPDPQLTDFKEALVMALIGVLRWREENNVLASVTGASRDSIGGAVWIGQEG
ncbi:MAG TPA: anhydro-N-acetylmuramic acid kinase [Puia sp.]|jgi:anhydro-N-acetylmuramic acid kinase